MLIRHGRYRAPGLRRLLWLAVLAMPLCRLAAAQERPADALAALSAPIIDVVSLAGLPERVFDAHLEADEAASFYLGSKYDVTYQIDPTGKLTVQFFNGKAGFFRLITHRPCPTAEELPQMLGIDTRHLELVEEIDVKKVWRGVLGGQREVEVAAIQGPAGWNTAVIKITAYLRN